MTFQELMLGQAAANAGVDGAIVGILAFFLERAEIATLEEIAICFESAAEASSESVAVRLSAMAEGLRMRNGPVFQVIEGGKSDET